MLPNFDARCLFVFDFLFVIRGFPFTQEGVVLLFSLSTEKPCDQSAYFAGGSLR